MNQKRWFTPQRMMGLFIIFIMISSVGGVIISYQDTAGTTIKETYNGQTIEITPQGLYKIKIQGQEFLFTTHPSDVEGIQIPPEFQKALESKNVQISYNANLNSSEKAILADRAYYLGQVLENQRYKITRGIHETTKTTGLPDIVCMDAKITNPVLYITMNETIPEQPYCYTITGNNEQQIQKMTERIAYYVLGVVQ